MATRRYYFSTQPSLNRLNARVKCRVLAIGPRRQAIIAGKYAGGVFCNLPDGAVCMCSYSFHYADSAFSIGNKVMLIIQQYDMEKKQIYGKIVSKW